MGRELSREARWELQRDVRSQAAHRVEDEVRDYLQRLYFHVIPPEEFETFLAACAETNNHRRDTARQQAGSFPSVIKRGVLLRELRLSVPRQSTLDGARFAAAVRQALGGSFSESSRLQIVQCFDLAALFKVSSMLDSFEPAGYDVFPHLLDACGEGIRALASGTQGCKSCWQELNARGGDVRNDWFGHPNAHTFAKMEQSRWIADVQAMRTIVAAVRLEALEESWRKAMAALRRAASLKMITVKDLADGCDCDEETALAALGEAGEKVRENTCYGVEEELVAAVGRFVGARQREDRDRQLRQELEQARAALQVQARGEAGWQTLRQKLFTQKLAGVQPLELLAGYQGGALDRRALLELASTHRFVLDDSLLRRGEERRFVEGPLLDALRQAGRDPRQALLVEATTLYRLMRQTEERERLYKRMLACAGDESRAAELEALRRRHGELTEAKNAYMFVRSSLKLGPAGYPDPLRSGDDTLLDLLEDNCFERLCVLTAGATALPARLDRSRAPFAVIARVSRDMTDPGGGCVCRIFRSCLPFAGVRQDDQLLQGLREKTDRLCRQALDEAQRARWQQEDVLDEVRRMARKQPPAVPLSQRPAGDGAQEDPLPDAPADDGPAGQPAPLADDSPLSLDRPVEQGDELVTEKGDPVKLLEPLTEGGEPARGGEGALYLCSLPGMVAKIYHPDQLTARRRDKLLAMLARDPGLDQLCWPAHLLYNGGGQFVGFLMRRAPEGAMPFSKTVLKIGGSAVQKELLKDWTRRDLIRAAWRVAQLMDRLHRANILMGDVNAGNFMADPANSANVFIVDTDSFQFDGYPCPVGTDEFTCPFVWENGAARPRPGGPVRYGELLRSLEEEQFALAVLLFEILFCGQNPFVSKGQEGFLRCMRERRFPYAVQSGEVWSVPDGDNWMIWKNLPAAVTTAFTDTFVEWKPRSAGQWARLLKRYLELVVNGVFTDELTPVKYHEFNRDAPFFVDVRCPSELCGHREFNMPREKLDKIAALRPGQNRDALFCRDCRGFLTLHGDKLAGEPVVCSVCGRPFRPTIRQVLYHEADHPLIPHTDYICDDCANPTVECACCHKTMRVPRHRLLQAREKQWELYCADCLQLQQAPCACCGAPVTVPLWQKRQSEQGGRVLLCESCAGADTLTATCDRCGQRFEVARNVFVGVRRGGRVLLCRSCLRGGWAPRGRAF